MKEIINNQLIHIKTFLIERRGELDDVLESIKEQFGHGDTNLDAIYSRVLNGYVSVPTSYPYVAIFTQDTMDDDFCVTFVSPEAFQSGKDESMFDFEIKRTSNESPYVARFSRYTIVAKDIFAAHVRLGQVYHNDEAYELEVVSVNQVK